VISSGIIFIINVVESKTFYAPSRRRDTVLKKKSTLSAFRKDIMLKIKSPRQRYPLFNSVITHCIYLKIMNSSNKICVCSIFLVKCLWCPEMFVFKKN